MVNFKENKGITLIALIITIIVLLILAGITINLTIGQGGIMNMAEKAGENYIDAKIEEDKILGDYENKIGQYVDGSRDTIVSMTKSELNDLIKTEVKVQVQEMLDIKSISVSNIVYNEEYVKTDDGTWIIMERSGNTIILTYSVRLKKDIPNSETVLFSGVPTASQVHDYTNTASYGSTYDIRTRIKDASVYAYWQGETISSENGTKVLGGTIVYLTSDE